MLHKTLLVSWFFILVFAAGCANTTTAPYVPPDPPTPEELADLLGDWEGLSETTTGLLDLINLTFYESNDNIIVTVYLNDTYVDDVYVDYNGDRVYFSSYSLIGDFGEFDGVIDHEELVYTGVFYIQTGLSSREGTFVIYKQ